MQGMMLTSKENKRSEALVDPKFGCKAVCASEGSTAPLVSNTYILTCYAHTIICSIAL